MPTSGSKRSSRSSKSHSKRSGSKRSHDGRKRSHVVRKHHDDDMMWGGIIVIMIIQKLNINHIHNMGEIQIMKMIIPKWRDIEVTKNQVMVKKLNQSREELQEEIKIIWI